MDNTKLMSKGLTLNGGVAMDRLEMANRIIETAKRKKIEYCESNGLPIPSFDKAEDFIITQPRPTAMWEQRWKCSNCGTIYSFRGYGYLPDTCPECKAIMTNGECF